MSNTPKAAAKKAEEFHGNGKAREIGRAAFEVPTALVFMGEGVALTYKSDKKLRNNPKAKRDYEHRFGAGVKVYCDPEGKTILISGGRMNVTDWIRY